VEWLIQILNSVQYGLLLFLVASGLTLIFGIMGVINLAHGSFYMIGAYAAFSLAQWTGSLWTALPLGIVLAAALGLALEKLLVSRLYRRDHLYQVLLGPEARLTRDQLLAALTERKIGTGVHYRAVHLHPYYRDKYGLREDDLPVASDISERTLSLPLSPKVSESDQDDVVDSLTDLLS